MFKMDNKSEAISSAQHITTTLCDEHSAAFSASTTGLFAAGNDNIDHTNHQFNDMDFDKVQVVGADLKV